MSRWLRFPLSHRRGSEVIIGRHRVPTLAGAAIYEIDGRVIARAVDWTDGPSLEREEISILDGYPDLDPIRLGDFVVSAAARSRRNELPASWPKLLEHAQPLFDASPGRFRSYRSWQRKSRHIEISVRPDGVDVNRLHADLARGSWQLESPDIARHAGYLQAIRVPLPTDVATVGQTVLDLLAEPPIAG